MVDFTTTIFSASWVDTHEPDHVRVDRLPSVANEYHLYLVHVQHRPGRDATGQVAHHRVSTR